MTTNREQLKRSKHQLRKNRVRQTIIGKTDRPRLAVFRSASHIYAQIIDDKHGRTLASASSLDFKDKVNKTEISAKVGTAIAEKAKTAGISSVVFDRGGFRYHGRVKALAEAARTAGLQF